MLRVERPPSSRLPRPVLLGESALRSRNWAPPAASGTTALTPHRCCCGHELEVRPACDSQPSPARTEREHRTRGVPGESQWATAGSFSSQEHSRTLPSTGSPEALPRLPCFEADGGRMMSFMDPKDALPSLGGGAHLPHGGDGGLAAPAGNLPEAGASEALAESLLPGLPNDVALHCLVRVSRGSHPACRAVSTQWNSTVSSPAFKALRRDLGLLEPTLMVRVAWGSGKAYQWFALLPGPDAQPQQHPRQEAEGAPPSPGEQQQQQSTSSGPSSVVEAAVADLEEGGPASSGKCTVQHSAAPILSSNSGEPRPAPSSSLLQPLGDSGAGARCIAIPAAIANRTVCTGSDDAPQKYLLWKLPDPPRRGKSRGGGHGAVVSGGQLYLLGGMGEGAKSTRDVLRFCPVAEEWERAPPMRSARAYFGCWPLPSGDICVAGGHSDDFRELSTAEIYDREAGMWTDGPLLPSEITSFDCATWKGRLMVTEGWHWPFHFSPRGFSFDVESWRWGSLTTGLCEGWMGPSFVWQGHLMAVVDDKPGQSAVSLYRPQADTWVTLEGCQGPPPMSGPFAVAVDGDKLYLVGKGITLATAMLCQSLEGAPLLTWSNPTNPLFPGGICNMCEVVQL